MIEYIEEVKRMSRLYKIAELGEARKCYEQYVGLLIIELDRGDQEDLRGLWRKLR